MSSQWIRRSTGALVILGATSALVACGPGVASPIQTVTSTVTATATATPVPNPGAGNSESPVIAAADAQHIVEVLCRVSMRYGEFEQVSADLQARPDLFKEARDLAGEVAFSLDAAPPLLLAGPSGGWSDPWLALGALAAVDSLDSSRPLFESAARATSAEELVGMTMGVLSNPLDDPLAYELAQRLPNESREQLTACMSL